MVNYHDPAVIAQNYMVLSRLWHAVAGLYFWEFVTTLDYEWRVFRKRLPFRWTIWIYFTTRIATLLTVVLCLVDINAVGRFDCKVETILLLTFAFLTTSAASLLIVLRIVAIWNMKKIVMAIAIGAWGTCFISQTQTIVRVRVKSIPGTATCVLANPQITNVNTLVGFTTDITLLLIMFVGLFRLHFHKSSAFGMGRLLWRQALIWLLVAFIADILPVVLICLNLNAPLDDIFLSPWVVASSIAATRIHRGLVDYTSAGRTEQLFDPSHSTTNSRTEWKANKVPITRTQLSCMEVAIPDMYEQDETTQMSQHSPAGSIVDVEGQLYGKPAGQIRFDETAEIGVGPALESSMT